MQRNKIQARHAFDIRVYGLVQGVGFRPFIYNLATRLRLAGWALNRNDCVQIRVQGPLHLLEEFVQHLRQHAPPLSHIEKIVSEQIEVEELTEFKILHSQNHSTDVTRVSPDVAVCQNCLDDMKQQNNRIDYPFVNCTNCGPRFSIITDLPYDRAMTTMRGFKMCDRCRQEYRDIQDRRFHAQPNACRACGPEYELHYQEQVITGIDVILHSTCRLLAEGQIVAIKGVGGFHLACDATNEQAVATLRMRKVREGKPFAVMFGSLDKAREYAEITEAEADLLLSEKRPIVLVKKKIAEAQAAGLKRKDAEAPSGSALQGISALNLAVQRQAELAPSVARGLDTLGIMLPYTPLHHLMFERLSLDAIVLTSGNLSDEPIVITNDDAAKTLTNVADALLMYNRDIHNRSDDSVAMVVNNKTRLLRRSRGWVPEPVRLTCEAEGIVAAGAELKNCFCVGKGRLAILSQHIGDLKNLETYEFYQEAFTRFTRLFRVEPELIACDLHPDYLSTRFAKDCGLPRVAVQHHHAHIASCMAEFGLNEQVIGVSFDGTGLGDDYHIWGGEFLICDLSGYTRFSHFDYVPMPGGDKAAEEPWRMGVACLYKTFGRDFLDTDVPFLHALNRNKLDLLLASIDKGINCPLTSSVGRLFDAVAAIINFVTIASFEAEAPIRLAASLARKRPACEQTYRYDIEETVIVDKLIEDVVHDVQQHIPISVIAARFHQTLAAIIVALAEKVRKETGIRIVVLSGGVFQNSYLLEMAAEFLTQQSFAVYSNLQVPANDGGICLGQLAVAAKRREVKLK